MVAIATIATHDPWEHPVGRVLLVPAMDISVVVASRPNVAPEEELRTAALADRLGYADLWVGEGFVWDAFALATAAGLATERIPITVGPIPVSVRDPASIARGAASTAALVHRPVGVALGTSSIRVVERMHGRSRRRAVTTLAESAQAVRALFGGGQADFDGETVSTHGYRLRLDPPGGTITVAAFGDRAIAVAAEYADRMVLDLVSPELARGYRDKLDAAARAAGRPAPKLAAWIPAAVDPDPASTAQIMQSLAGYLEVAGYGEMFTAAGLGDAVRLAQAGADRDQLLAALPEEAAGRIGLVGDPDTVNKRLGAYADAGLDEVVLVPATDGDPGGERTLTALAKFA
ncbi:MAG TPA: LLM class F420-dependent oxidoreductase [Pseudonocardia sp.]|uniref:LLM class F420-dependent oxidoreductase n=1 Tax=Pseudonocardia sp. TaxID=60912 RepID=UPI002BA60334|nr:LLM class F420-dependent oxidoreductase [Pseudonocardia sp.]HTF46622.1 LLM class F420-dependent oxidoreductase [Pseudonocardia sp.]